MNLLYRFINNIGFSIISDFVIRLGNTLIIILLSKFHNGATAGSFNLALTYFYIGSVISNWGFGNLLIREVGRKEEFFRKAFFNYSFTRMLFGLLSAFLIIFLAKSSNYYSNESRIIVQLIALTIPIDSVNNLCQSAFNAYEKIKFTTIISMIANIIKISIGFFIISTKNFPLTYLGYLYLFISIVTLFLNLFFVKGFLKPISFDIDLVFCYSQVKLALPFFVMSIFFSMDNRIDIIILSFLEKEEAIGYYSAMNTLLGVLYLFPEGIRNSIFPIFSRYESIDPNRLEKNFIRIFNYIIIISMPIMAICFFFAKELVFLLFSREFVTTIDLFRIGIFSFLAYSLSNIFSRLLIVKKLEKWVVLSLLISSFFTIIGNLVVIPRFGLFGVAGIKTFTSILLLVLFFLLTNKYVFTVPIKKIFIKITLSSVLMIFVSLLSIYSKQIMILFFSILIYLLSLIFLRVLSEDEVLIFKRFFRSFFNVK